MTKCPKCNNKINIVNRHIEKFHGLEFCSRICFMKALSKKLSDMFDEGEE